MAVLQPSNLAPVPHGGCRPIINVPEGFEQVNVNVNASCVVTFYSPSQNRSAPPYDETGAMRFSASVIAIYGLSLALLIGMTVKRNETDHEVKGFLRSLAKLDMYRKQSEKNKMKHAIRRFHAGLRGQISKKNPQGGVGKARNRHRRRSHERNVLSMQLVEWKSSKQNTTDATTVALAPGKIRTTNVIHHSILPSLNELEEEKPSCSSAIDGTESTVSTIW